MPRPRSAVIMGIVGRIHPRRVHGFAATGPDRTFVDCAGSLSLIELIQLGDVYLFSSHAELAMKIGAMKFEDA